MAVHPVKFYSVNGVPSKIDENGIYFDSATGELLKGAYRFGLGRVTQESSCSDVVGPSRGDVNIGQNGETHIYNGSGWILIGNQSIPIATSGTIGGVKIGKSISIDENGRISAYFTTDSLLDGESEATSTKKLDVDGKIWTNPSKTLVSNSFIRSKDGRISEMTENTVEKTTYVHDGTISVKVEYIKATGELNAYTYAAGVWMRTSGKNIQPNLELNNGDSYSYIDFGILNCEYSNAIFVPAKYNVNWNTETQLVKANDLPKASSSALGCVKVGSNLSSQDGTLTTVSSPSFSDIKVNALSSILSQSGQSMIQVVDVLPDLPQEGILYFVKE